MFVWAPKHVVLIIALAILQLIPFWRIFRGTGYPGWLALGTVVPIANLALLWFLAFARWRVRRKKETTEERRGPIATLRAATH
jgi:hypothetical protein